MMRYGPGARVPPKARAMFQIIGVVIVFAMVFGGFLLAGGHFDVILKALPFEMMMIGGAAVGAFLIGNSFKTVMAAVSGFGKILSGPKWKAKDYTDLLSLLFALTKTMKTKGVVAIEAHIENPKDSALFQQYPRILKDHFACDLICDTLRMMTMNLEDPHQVEEVIDRQIEKHHHEAHKAAHALQTMADALPALGIVAAVLGIIKTMSAIDQPPAYLGKLIGSALVGTFLGVFLAYGLIGPFAARLGQVIDEEGAFYKIIKDVLVAHLHGNAAQVSVEIGRGQIPSSAQPSFAQLEEALSAVTI
jgi:chemotaxis protein MotA